MLSPETIQENYRESNPNDPRDSLLSLMQRVIHLGETRKMNSIIGGNEDIEKQITELEKLLEEATEKAKQQNQIFLNLLLNKIDFGNLRRINSIVDVAEKREELMEVLDDKGISYQHLL